MKSTSEFKGYRTRIDFDAESKQFRCARAADPFPAASETAAEVADEKSAEIAVAKKHAA